MRHSGATEFPRERLIPLESSEEWQKALAPLPHTFAHTWDHCYAMHLTSGLTSYLYAVETETAAYVCPLAERTVDGFVDVVTPYGFSGFTGVGDGAELPTMWKSFARRRGYVAGFIMQNPVLPETPYSIPDDAYSQKHVYVVDLTRSIDDLCGLLDDNRRRQFRSWSEISTAFVFDVSALTAFILENYERFFRTRNAASVYSFTPETFSHLTGLKNILVVGAASGGHITAVSMFGYTAEGGDYLFNVSSPDGRHHSASLIWYAVRRLKALGVPSLNLGGGVVEDDGIAQFKQRFGGRRMPLTYLKQVYDSTRYAELCHGVGADPADRSGFFPAYRRP
jgi:hypothetical protein